MSGTIGKPVALFGATGYAGREAARLLAGHPVFRLAAAFGGPERAGVPLSAIHPALRGGTDLSCRGLDLNGGLDPAVARLADEGVGLAILATPEEASVRLAGALRRAGLRLVDLSGAFRLRPAASYPEWYGFEHPAPEILERAAYGLPEWEADAVAAADVVANPGCYPTSALLALLPLRRSGLLDPSEPVVVHAVSGASGAGRRLREDLLFCEIEGSIRPYGLPRHRHLAEIAAAAGLVPGEQIVFVPHLVPIERGLLATLSLRLAPGTGADDVAAAFETAYAGAPFVRRLGEGVLPSTGEVRGTNTCAIGWCTDARHGRVTVCAAIDNLVKGAAGQAVQNLNLMTGLQPQEGLPR